MGGPTDCAVETTQRGSMAKRNAAEGEPTNDDNNEEIEIAKEADVILQQVRRRLAAPLPQ